MTKAALTKLVFLVTLAFIICLPEFFTLFKATNVSLRCERYQLCGDQESSDSWRNKTCHKPSLCPSANQSNVTEPHTSCFVCEGEVNMTKFELNSSSSAQSDYLEVWLDLHLNNTESMNLTLFGRYNPSTLQLHLSDDEGDGDGGEDDEGPREVSLYCLPSLDTANPIHCLLWLSRQTLAGAKAGLPWKRTTNDEWRCVLKVLWLTLLCAVLLLVVAVLGEILWRKHTSDKPKIHPVISTFTEQHFNNKEIYCEINTPEVIHLHPKLHFQSVLYPIEEVDTPDETETETLLDGNIDNGCNGHLHHRSASSTSIRRTDLVTVTTKES